MIGNVKTATKSCQTHDNRTLFPCLTGLIFFINVSPIIGNEGTKYPQGGITDPSHHDSWQCAVYILHITVQVIKKLLKIKC